MQDKYIKIIIHAGAHKTASTHLQNRLLSGKADGTSKTTKRLAQTQPFPKDCVTVH